MIDEAYSGGTSQKTHDFLALTVHLYTVHCACGVHRKQTLYWFFNVSSPQGNLASEAP